VTRLEPVNEPGHVFAWTLDESKIPPSQSPPDPCRKMPALLAAYPAEQPFVRRFAPGPPAGRGRVPAGIRRKC